MDFKFIKPKVDFVVWIIFFCWLLYIVGSQYTLQNICKSHNSSLYLYINHDFQTVKNINPFDNNYHCLKEIPIKTCYAGQKEILFGVKCKINEEIGVKYGYIK